jgi:phenylpyruvate tautomerase PptA (4-oxalocrotonate tautomerase family)
MPYVIQEIDEEDWGFAGELTDSWRQRQQAPSGTER